MPSHILKILSEKIVGRKYKIVMNKLLFFCFLGWHLWSTEVALLVTPDGTFGHEGS